MSPDEISAAGAAWVFLAVAGLGIMATGLIYSWCEDNRAHPRLVCEHASGTWVCRGVSGSDGEKNSGESCACLDGGTP